jgi:hypothetical protein
MVTLIGGNSGKGLITEGYSIFGGTSIYGGNL